MGGMQRVREKEQREREREKMECYTTHHDFGGRVGICSFYGALSFPVGAPLSLCYLFCTLFFLSHIWVNIYPNR